MFHGRRTSMAIVLKNHIGLSRPNIVKRHPLRSVPRLDEERCAAAELDQLWRQVSTDQNGLRGIGDTPVRVSIVLYAHAILQEDSRRYRAGALLRLHLGAPARQLCG